VGLALLPHSARDPGPIHGLGGGTLPVWGFHRVLRFPPTVRKTVPVRMLNSPSEQERGRRGWDFHSNFIAV